MAHFGIGDFDFLEEAALSAVEVFLCGADFNSLPVLPPCLRRMLIDLLDPVVLHLK